MKPIHLTLLLLAVVWSWTAAERSRHTDLRSEAETLRARNRLLATQLYGLDRTDPATGESLAVGLIRRAIEIEGVAWGDEEVEAMARLCWRESRYNPLLQNPRSTAFGLWQFLDSTWQYYGIEKTTDPLLQTVAAVRYIEDRYGTPSAALDFHLVAREVNGEMQHYY